MDPRFEVLAELGSGSFGAVLRAFDRKLGREVAVKVVLQLGPAEAARFVDEARALLRVNDPGVVRILDVDISGDRPFLVMELVRGETLEARLRRGPLELREVASLGTEIARTLEHLHAVGVVHRDLKPANVVIRPDGQPVLIDLGLALLLDRSARLSRTGEVIGTPVFMSPEQAEGRTRELGPAADVYGLGATLFALLTGRPPFEATSYLEVIQAVIHQVPPPPSRLRPGLGPGLDRIVLACLAKDPLARPDLRQVRAALLAPERGPAPAAHRPLLAAGAVGLLSLGLGCLALARLWAGGAPAPAPPPRVAPPPPPAPGPAADLRAAAEAGDLQAMVELGNAAYLGEPGPRDLAAAAAWYRRAAEAGSLEGMTCLGSLHVTGEGVPRDAAQALRWLGAAAEQGSARAMCNLGALHEDGAPGLPADLDRAVAWYRRSAQAGWPLAMVLLANLSFEGRGVPRSDPEGARWIRAAAEAGDPAATTRLAQLHEVGRGVPRSPPIAARLHARAAELLRQEAEAGSAKAMVELGTLHARGCGVPRDPAAAARWWTRAMERGHTGACYWLAVLHFDGTGAARDVARAQALFRRDDQPRTRDYAALYLYLCALELRDEPSGLAALRALRDRERGWTSEVAAALLGERREEDLLAAARVPADEKASAGRRCLAAFYLGAQRLLRGDRARGEGLLRECLATGVTEYPQHGSAQALLAR